MSRYPLPELIEKLLQVKEEALNAMGAAESEFGPSPDFEEGYTEMVHVFDEAIEQLRAFAAVREDAR